jgi:hypothetical protein
MLECIVQHVPPVDCGFRDHLIEWYRPYNQRLYEWIKVKWKSPYKDMIPFIPFVEPTNETMPCVVNARKYYDKLISKSKIAYCDPSYVKHQTEGL